MNNIYNILNQCFFPPPFQIKITLVFSYFVLQISKVSR